VGKYTQPQASQPTRTQQFRLCDITFFHQQQPLSLSTFFQNPTLPDLVHLQIDNQKNGQQGQIVAHHAITNPCCPVKALAARVFTVLTENATPDTLICAYWPTPNNLFLHVTNEDIVLAIYTALAPNLSTTHGYLPKLVGSHLLQASGAMALFIQGYDATAIMKIGHWTSTAFMSYIHEQLDVVSQGATQSMSEVTPFLNLNTTTPDN